MASSQPADKKPRGLSRFLGRHDKPEQQQQPVLPDSAYASSDTPSRDPSSRISNPASDEPTPHDTPDVVPAAKDSEIGSIDRSKDLAVKPSTGEVIDRNTGEVITVVTTTTTTTRTIAKRAGQEVPLSEDVQESVQRMERTIPGTGGGEVQTAPPQQQQPPAPPVEMPADNQPIPRPPEDIPALPPRTSTLPSQRIPQDTPYDGLRSQGGQYSRAPYDPVSPVGQQNPNLPYGGEEAPISPVQQTNPTFNERPITPSRTNFSYPRQTPQGTTPPRTNPDPQRQPIGLTTTDQPQHHNRSTISDLKAAAKGIHGVGETLRGTFNSAVDQNFPRKNAEKMAYANAKNEAALARGRSEMEGIPIHHAQGYSAHPMEPDAPVQSPVGDDRERQKVSSIGKLFSRRPVSGETDLRVRNP